MPREKRNTHYTLFSRVLWAWTVLSLIAHIEGAAYKDVLKIFEDKLGSNYKTTIRPLLDQSEKIQVEVSFDIVAIVEIDAITQKFVINGFLGLEWKDELLSWDPSEYNNTYYIHPEPKQIWRPRLILTNTMDDRDLFEDDYCPTTSEFDGNTSWFPGSLFPTSCKLDLYKYPFDEQECFIELYSMAWNKDELVFVSDDGKIGTNFYTKSGEWEVAGTSLNTYDREAINLPFFRLNFKLRRLPGFFIVNIVIPIVLMSFLNILVFLIPVDSGEKISYGITVLLALTVFMSIVSDQLPRSSDTLPLVTIYLLVLTVISVCTVIVSIVIVFTHHREESDTKHRRATSNFKSAFKKFNIMNRARKNFSHVQVKPASADRQFSNSSTTNVDKKTHLDTKSKPSDQDSVFNILKDMRDNLDHCKDVPEVEDGTGGCDGDQVNRWRQFGKHVDCISFVVFTVMWISVTIGFLVEISR